MLLPYGVEIGYSIVPSDSSLHTICKNCLNMQKVNTDVIISHDRSHEACWSHLGIVSKTGAKALLIDLLWNARDGQYAGIFETA